MDENMPKFSGSAQGTVYFLKMAQFVKIGFTLDFQARFAQLERGLPEVPQVLATVSASRGVESTLHRRLHPIALRCEWYLDCEEVRAAMADAIAGRVDETVRIDGGSPRPICPNIKWASESLAKIAGTMTRDEPQKQIIERVAKRVGLSYWRTFDLWYRKARRLGIEEKAAISAALVGG